MQLVIAQNPNHRLMKSQENTTTNKTEYIGNELALFRHAINWKSYYAKHLKPYIRGGVLEVGAGIGETTGYLITTEASSWLCLEPDPQMSGEIQKRIDAGDLPSQITVFSGYLSDLPQANKFKTIIYIDVIEHIENDKSEIERAYNHLVEGGHLIILVPAHNALYSPFDEAIGHYRRYNKMQLRKAVDNRFHEVFVRYLDVIGLATSFANRTLLKQSHPTVRQIKIWDKIFVRISRIIDPLLNYNAGKTVIGVWRK
jgi:SAM-dependent methyltransferase